MSAAQHTSVNLLKTKYEIFFVITCHSIFNVWLKTTLPVWPRDAKRLDTHGRLSLQVEALVGGFVLSDGFVGGGGGESGASSVVP